MNITGTALLSFKKWLQLGVIKAASSLSLILGQVLAVPKRVGLSKSSSAAPSFFFYRFS